MQLKKNIRLTSGISAWGWILAALFGALVSCAPEEITDDPKLIGTWENPTLRYVFRNDKTYSQIFLRKGRGSDTTRRDSLFGKYQVDGKRNNITFTLEGFRVRDTARSGADSFYVVLREQNAGVWNYTVSDSVLNYNSGTQRGELRRK